MKKILVISVVMLLLYSLMMVSFADNPNDLDSWKNGANDNLLNGASNSTRDIGASADALIRTIGKILISIIVSVIGMKFIWGKDAQAKKDIKGQIINLVGGAVVIYFGIDILIMILAFFKDAFM